MDDDKCPLLYTDDIETIPVDEADDIARIVAAKQKFLSRHHAKSGEFVADVHVKPHGYVKAEFRVLPNLPEELAQGLFEYESVFLAVVRFSNAASQAQADALPDGRGMAIKVLSVTGEIVSADEPNALLPRQEIAALREQVEYQNLAFNVWHALAAHRPLGGINRVRRAAYPVSSAWRRQPTGVKSDVPPSD